MPIIRIDFDPKKVDEKEVEALSKAIRVIVSEKTDIKDVIVYVSEPLLVLEADPIEIFVEMSAHIMEKNQKLMSDIKTALLEWKSNEGYKYPINLTLIPMHWQIEIGI